MSPKKQQSLQKNGKKMTKIDDLGWASFNAKDRKGFRKGTQSKSISLRTSAFTLAYLCV